VNCTTTLCDHMRGKPRPLGRGGCQIYDSNFCLVEHHGVWALAEINGPWMRSVHAHGTHMEEVDL
jgi:hypothetical protein